MVGCQCGDEVVYEIVVCFGGFECFGLVDVGFEFGVWCDCDGVFFVYFVDNGFVIVVGEIVGCFKFFVIGVGQEIEFDIVVDNDIVSCGCV